MAEGAVGMSAGLTYTPGMYADNDELLALCRMVGELGGYYARTTARTARARWRRTPR